MKKNPSFHAKPNGQTPIIYWLGDRRIKEDSPVYGAMPEIPSTPNAQRKMKKKTPNAERRKPNIEWKGSSFRISEDAPLYGTTRQKDSTPNAQRPTSNAQRKRNSRFNLEDRLLEFSARIIRLVDALPNTRAGNHVAGQLLRCGTSPYGHHGEVEAAESRKDFVHKLKVCLKELKETRRWLRLIQKAEMLPKKTMVLILGETEELIRIFFTSIRTAEQNAK